MGFLANYISKEMLERERGVVQNEKRQGENQPVRPRRTTPSTQRLYPYSHPYSWSTIGSMDDLNAASLEDIKEWYAHLLRPEQRGHFAGRRHHAGALEGTGDEVFRRHSAGPVRCRAPNNGSRSSTATSATRWKTTCRRRASTALSRAAVEGPISAQHLALLGEILSGSPSARLERRLITRSSWRRRRRLRQRRRDRRLLHRQRDGQARRRPA
jgi:zinc protease